MKCDWKYITEPDERGYRRSACQRSGCNLEANTSYAHDLIESFCHGTPAWHKFGEWLEIALAVIWLDKRRWLLIKQWLGLQPKCGCQERQAALNTFGHRLRASLLQLWQRLVLAFAARISRLPGHVQPQLLAPDFDATRSSNAESAASLTNLNDLDADIMSDDNALTFLALKHKHDDSP